MCKCTAKLQRCKVHHLHQILVSGVKSVILTVKVTTYNPAKPDIKGFIHNNWNIIEHSNDCASTFQHKPLIGFKRLPNLRNLLTKAEIS